MGTTDRRLAEWVCAVVLASADEDPQARTAAAISRDLWCRPAAVSSVADGLIRDGVLTRTWVDPAGTAAYSPSDALHYAFVLLGGRFSGPTAPAAALAADICRLVLAHGPITSGAIGARLRKKGATAEPQSEIDAAARLLADTQAPILVNHRNAYYSPTRALRIAAATLDPTGEQRRRQGGQDRHATPPRRSKRRVTYTFPATSSGGGGNVSPPATPPGRGPRRRPSLFAVVIVLAIAGFIALVATANFDDEADTSARPPPAPATRPAARATSPPVPATRPTAPATRPAAPATRPAVDEAELDRCWKLWDETVERFYIGRRWSDVEFWRTFECLEGVLPPDRFRAFLEKTEYSMTYNAQLMLDYSERIYEDRKASWESYCSGDFVDCSSWEAPTATERESIRREAARLKFIDHIFEGWRVGLRAP